MNHSQQIIAKSIPWLRDDVFPLWLENGIDKRSGSFEESLSREGVAQPGPRRVMVQARQIYAFAEGGRLGVLAETQVSRVVHAAAFAFVERYSLPNGAFVHAVDANGKHVNLQLDLYAQAFALFGLAEAYGLLREPVLKERALKLLGYLQTERRLPEGGYAEMNGGKIGYEANPHMHLLEAAVAWMRVDADERWRELAMELQGLCRQRFFDRESGALCEHFSEGWRPLREDAGFVWEPGHHCEWAWLLAGYKHAVKQPVDELPFALFARTERSGLDQSGAVIDEVWSSGRVKKASARFWPQGERVKAAVALGAVAPPGRQAAFAAAADQAMACLFTYFADIQPGLWADTRDESGVLVRNESVKASSLYHIINAIAEYTRLRPQLTR